MKILNDPVDDEKNGIELVFTDGTKDQFDPIESNDIQEDNGVLKIWGGEPNGWEFPVNSIESLRYYQF